MGVNFFLTNILLGAGLAMDACAVSMSNGLDEPNMSRKKHIAIAVTFAVFQALMPLIGYFAGFTAVDIIGAYVPWIALGVLVFLGGKMIFDGVKEFKSEKRAAVAKLESAAANADADSEPIDKNTTESDTKRKLTAKVLFVQAIATSIDALGVGLTIIDYTIVQAITAAALIAAVTFLLCIPSVYIGRKFGDRLGKTAVIVGGVILIAIGIEICLTGVL